MKISPAGFLFFVAFLFSSSIVAREVTVCSSGCAFGSIQAAVDKAAAGDTILVSGVITESGILISKNITIRGLGQTATVIQAHADRGAARHRIFYINGGAVVVIEQLTIRNGKERADPTAWNGSGGGILIDGSSTSISLKYVTIKHCDNDLSDGGGITLGGNDTSLDLDNCVFENNVADNGSGGALYLSARTGDCLVRNTAFKANIAANGNGGAAVVGDRVSVAFISCSFTGNQALNGKNGGGVYSVVAVPTFNNCQFSYNKAEQGGGALHIVGANIANCVFLFNTAVNGGAISRGTAPLKNELSLLNCTLLNNSATGFAPAGAGLHDGFPASGLIHLVGNTIENSTSGIDLYLYAPSSLSTNQKNKVGQAHFATGSARFASN